jgi:hypothetical protein
MNQIEQYKSDLRHLRMVAESMSERMGTAEEAFRLQVKNLRDAFEQNNAELILEFNNVQYNLDACESNLRKELAAWYGETGEKTYDKDLGVRVSKKFEYSDRDAIAWSKENCRAAVVETVNKKAFEATAQVVGIPEFVTVKETVTAVIAKELSPLFEEVSA